MSDQNATIVCRDCNQEKQAEEFNRDSSTKTGRSRYCRKCWVDRRVRQHEADKADPERMKRRLKKNLAWGRKNMRKRNNRFLYGLEEEEYQAILDRQGGVCAICRNPERTVKNGKVCNLSVDHDHKTGKVRGLLCNSCNNLLGRAKDDPNTLRAAATYLELCSEM